MLSSRYIHIHAQQACQAAWTFIIVIFGNTTSSKTDSTYHYNA
jgi:hypothetical protein